MRMFFGILVVVSMISCTRTSNTTVIVNGDNTSEKISPILMNIIREMPEYQWKYPLVLPALDYAYDKLEPQIDAKTMEIHHTKHHNAYTTNANTALSTNGLDTLLLVSVFYEMNRYNGALRNNGGGYYNHNLFWKFLTPGGSAFEGEVADAIVQQFETFENFKTKFSEAAASRFGSGWAWLVITADGKLAITSTANQNNPLMQGEEIQGVPLLNLEFLRLA